MIRIGQGFDFHRLVKGRPLVIGGLQIPYPKGEAGHSDGDVLLHAVIDALLGAAGLGDIGAHFPPSDPQWKNADSSMLTRAIVKLIDENGWSIQQIDSTVILERPKIRPFVDEIRRNIASVCNVDVGAVSVKGKTMEKSGPVGKGRGVEALVLAVLAPKE